MHLETALASVFVLKYGSIIVMDKIGYAEALPLYGLRQNIFTDPQKPMKVAPGIYPMNGATPDDPCALTVDFALTYFLVSGELERSKVPINLLITDASGMSVLTAWAAGKFSSTSVKKFFDEFDLAEQDQQPYPHHPGQGCRHEGRNSGQAAGLERCRRYPRGC